jgi:hypothetical protein
MSRCSKRYSILYKNRYAIKIKKRVVMETLPLRRRFKTTVLGFVCVSLATSEPPSEATLQHLPFLKMFLNKIIRKTSKPTN